MVPSSVGDRAAQELEAPGESPGASVATWKPPPDETATLRLPARSRAARSRVLLIALRAAFACIPFLPTRRPRGNRHDRPMRNAEARRTTCLILGQRFAPRRTIGELSFPKRSLRTLLDQSGLSQVRGAWEHLTEGWRSR